MFLALDFLINKSASDVPFIMQKHFKSFLIHMNYNGPWSFEEENGMEAAKYNRNTYPVSNVQKTGVSTGLT